MICDKHGKAIAPFLYGIIGQASSYSVNDSLPLPLPLLKTIGCEDCALELTRNYPEAALEEWDE